MFIFNQVIIEEAAKLALESASFRKYIADELDLSDEALEEAYRELKKKLDNA